MSYRTSAEQDLKEKLLKMLLDRGKGFQRAWLDPQKYNKDLSFDSKALKIEEERVIYPVYSYEVFDMDDASLINFLNDITLKIENFFITKINNAPEKSVISYYEDNIEISLEYRIALLKIKYSLSYSLSF